MAKGTGLVGAVVQRSIADWPVVTAAWLLLVCATTLIATGVVYGDAVAALGLHRGLEAAGPADRAVIVTADLDADRIDPVDATIRAELTRAFGPTGGEITRTIRSESFADRAVASADAADLTVFESLSGIEQHATLVDGRWPQAGGAPLEATLSEPAARAFGLTAGDRLALVNRQDATRTVDVVIVGVWQADPADAFFAGDPLELTGTNALGDFTIRGPLVVREADILGLNGPRARFSPEWRGIPSIAALRVDDVDALRTGIQAVPAFLRSSLPGSDNARVTTPLPDLLAESARSVLVSRSGIILLTLQFAVLAGYAIVLVAGIIVERRRNEIALLRSRGAGDRQLVAMAGLEAALLAVPAAVVAPWLALGAVVAFGTFGPSANLDLVGSANLGTSAFVVAGLAGLACIVALTLPTLAVAASPAGARAVQGRQARTTLVQRLGLDLAFVAVAAVALWQLRLYGAPITRTARGVLGLDPLLVAAPAIGLVGGAVLAVRIVPRIAELIERALSRRPGMVAALSGRQLARRPLRYTRTALLLMLAAALGTLAAAHGATWTRSQADQAAFQAVSDVRVSAADYSRLPSWAAGPVYRSIPGVIAATPVVERTFDLSRVVRDGRIVGLDPDASAVLAATPSADDRAERGRVLGLLAASRPELAGVPIPGTPRRIALTIDTSFHVDPTLGTGTIPPKDQLLDAGLILRDADGRLLRTPTASGSIVAAGQRLVVDLTDQATATSLGLPGLAPAGPLEIAGVELTIHAPDQAAIVGDAVIRGIEASDAAEGDGPWSPVPFDPSGPAWQWRLTGTLGDLTFPAPDQDATRVSLTQQHAEYGFPGASGLTARLGVALPDPFALPVVASQAFLDATSASVDDQLTVASQGQSIPVRVVGVTSLFAPYDPSTKLLIGDLGTVDLLGFEVAGAVSRADGWLLAVDPRAAPDVLAALRRPSSSTASVIGREERAAQLSTDPVALGLIGVLGIGSIAAILFAGIGFLVSSTVTTSERRGEFALMRALGLSVRQLLVWLSIESVFLLVVGLVAGWLLGLLLAWLVLPFATLTQTGAAPVPAPAVVIPPQAILPVIAAVVLLFIASIVPARRQVGDVRLSGVLRVRDE
jgi:FtsX-like permease family protein